MKRNPDALLRFLFCYRNSPHAVTGHSPSQMLFNRKVVTVLERIFPHRVSEIRGGNFKGLQPTVLESETSVWVKNFSPGPQWLLGKVFNRLDRSSYSI